MLRHLPTPTVRPWWLVAALASGCNAYDWFRVTGYVQEGFTNDADIVFILDNSTSMEAEGEAVATNFQSFIQAFAADDAVPSEPSLSNDVERYLDYVTDRTANVNYQIGVTTTEVGRRWGELLGQDAVVSRSDNDIEGKFEANVLCEAACIDDLPAGVNPNCAGASPEGNRNCADNSFGAAEEGIEAVFMAMCRAAADPPEACFQKWWERPTDPGRVQDFDPGLADTGGVPQETAPLPYFDENDVGSNGEWLREGSVVIPVIVSDEGDQSRRISTRDGDVFPYDELFRLFGHRMSWAVIGASLDNGCNTSGAADWGVERYQRLVASTNGLYIPIAVPDGRGNCTDADFSTALADVGGLLRAVSSQYPLASIPEPATITVRVGERSIAKAVASYDVVLEMETFTDGWSWDPPSNTVILHGTAVPESSERVRIWYLPAGGAPRPLPF